MAKLTIYKIDSNKAEHQLRQQEITGEEALKINDFFKKIPPVTGFYRVSIDVAESNVVFYTVHPDPLGYIDQCEKISTPNFNVTRK